MHIIHLHNFPFYLAAAALMTFIMLEYSKRKKLKKVITDIQSNLLNSFEEALIISDHTGKIRHKNESFQKLEEYFFSEVVNDIYSILPPYSQWKKEAEEIEGWSKERRKMIFEVSKHPFQLGKNSRYILFFKDISFHKKIESEIQYMAYHDTLTNLPNRHFVDEKINQAIKQNERVACLFLDMDRLKFTNDSLGHRAGDKLLVEVAQRLLKHKRDGEILARVGGDEFLFIVFNKRVDEIEEIACQCIQEMKEPFLIENQKLRITLSGGISVFPDDVKSADELIRVADLAMYDAKKNGKNRISKFDYKMEGSVRRRLLIEDLILNSLEQQECYLVYQTKIDLESNKVTGTEALVRWDNKEMGLVSPMEFIPIAEEIGFIHELGFWVLKKACLQWSEWKHLGYEPILMAVNISPLQFAQETFIDQVQNIIEETGMDPEFLELEITESSALAYKESTIKKLILLKEMGIRLALDDFGTGYSSFQHLNELPLQMLKIDRSFLKDIMDNSTQQSIVKSMIQLGHNMNLRVLMEGVEEQNQLDWLKEAGCDWVQGYLFSQPEKPETIVKKLLLA
ncbi:bifunctional diguanylate cyclase/phosphodiesterase [Alkalihalobacillus trypoxylicola]|nr:bifunctional diguanylate cyclase/phosphodiesterase [Alkalihalobacillus trypoxylicola]